MQHFTLALQIQHLKNKLKTQNLPFWDAGFTERKCIEHKLWTKIEGERRSTLHSGQRAEGEKGEEKKKNKGLEKLDPERVFR